jgi:hypothetical protein
MLARRNPRRHSSNSGNQERSTFTIWPMVVAIPPLFSGPTAQRFSIDAGTTDDSLEVPSAQKPNANIRPGEWIASYILREMQAAGCRPVSKPMNIRISWSEIWQPMGSVDGRRREYTPVFSGATSFAATRLSHREHVLDGNPPRRAGRRSVSGNHPRQRRRHRPSEVGIWSISLLTHDKLWCHASTFLAFFAGQIRRILVDFLAIAIPQSGGDRDAALAKLIAKAIYGAQGIPPPGHLRWFK